MLCFPAWGLGGWSLLVTPCCLSGLSWVGLPGWKWGEALSLSSFIILTFCLPLLSYTFPFPLSCRLYFSSFRSLFFCHKFAHGCRKHPSRGSSRERASSLLAFHAIPALCPSHGCQLPSFAYYSSFLFSFSHHGSQLLPVPLPHDTATSVLLSWKICRTSSACSPSCLPLF